MRGIYLSFLMTAFLFALGQEENELSLKEEKASYEYYQYDEDFLPAAFHKERRDSLRALLPDSTIAVFFSAPQRNRANDVYFEYHQDPNFYYLTGLREPNSMVIISKEEWEFDGKITDELIFVQERNPSAEIWNGRRLGQVGVKDLLEVKTVEVNDAFLESNPQFERFKRVYFIAPEALESQDTGSTDNLEGLFHHFQKKLGEESPIAEKHLNIMMAQLRQEKTEEELVLLRKAIQITCEAQNQLMREIHPEMNEYQTEAIIEYVFKSQGAEYTGFPSIQGSGENSCVLHYTSNRRPLENGGLLVSDVGAEYHGYTADVTRTIPPSGKFSKEEKIIYNLVLEAQQAGIDAAVVGESFWAPHLAALEVIQKGLKKLGIIEKPMEANTYFMHGTSHYLGLDVHDAGLFLKLEENQVITVEPGIYIAENSDCDPKWWNIGVRIEDDILITADGPENLSVCSPRTLKEVEVMMAK